jgi:hypothetical protein
MQVFEDYKVEWNGQEYTIPARSIMGAIGRIESVATLAELVEADPRGRPRIKMHLVSCAYGALLRYAGVMVTDPPHRVRPIPDEAVYEGMFTDAKKGGALTRQYDLALQGLLALMIPPKHVAEATAEAAPGKPEPAAPPAKLSRKRSS